MGVFYTVRSFVFRVSYAFLNSYIIFLSCRRLTLFIFDHRYRCYLFQTDRTVHVDKMNYNVIPGMNE